MLLDNAREVVAGCLDLRPDEVTFTPSGTHAVHLAVLGTLTGRRRISDRLLVSAVEHASVMHAGQWHASRGGSLEIIPVGPLGRIREDAASEALAAGPVAALALQSANHEVGTVQPLARVAEVAGAVPLVVDACASLGRLPLPPPWTAAAGSAHKWGGPPGVGVLLVRKGARWRNPFPGDDRVEERATGFENIPAALAAAAALQAIVEERDEVAVRQRRMVDRIRTVAATIPDTEVVGDPDLRLPHLVTFSCLYVDGEALVTELERRDFSVASGSACTASSLEPSHVLAAMGVLTHGNVRVSLTRDTTDDEVERFLREVPEVVRALRSEAGV